MSRYRRAPDSTLGLARGWGRHARHRLESRTGDVWPLNVGKVYTTLQRLERDGLVETDADGERSQKRYRITAAGARELADWLRAMEVSQ